MVHVLNAEQKYLKSNQKMTNKKYRKDITNLILDYIRFLLLSFKI